MTETKTAPLTMTVTRLIPAPPDAVFDAWLDPETLVKFMRPGPDTACRAAKTDPKEGGQFSITMGENADITLHGTYLEITRPALLRFTWEGPFSAPDSEVSLRFDARPDGTFVTLTHTRFPDAEIMARHDAGWSHILGQLEVVL